MIKIDNDALNFLYKNNSVVVVSLINVHLCWGTTPSKTPWIEVKKSFKADEKYNYVNYKGVSIYVNKNLYISEEAIIKKKNTSSLLGQQLYIEGVSFKAWFLKSVLNFSSN